MSIFKVQNQSKKNKNCNLRTSPSKHFSFFFFLLPFLFLRFLSPMAPGLGGLQLTSLAGGGDGDELEDVRLLDSYDEIDGGVRRIQVTVTGMTCAACSNSVESALTSLDGVLSASVALLQNKADVVFNSTLLKVICFCIFNFF